MSGILFKTERNLKQLLSSKLTRAFFIFLVFIQILPGETILTVRADRWYPFNDQPTAVKPGYVIELMKLIYGPDKVQIDYQLMPWNRSLYEVKEGHIDSIACALKEDVSGNIIPEKSCGIVNTLFFVLEGKTWRYNDVSSLNEIRIAVTAGYSYFPKLDKYIATHKENPARITELFGENPVTQGIKLLQNGKVDVFIEDERVFKGNSLLLKISPELFQVGGQGGGPKPIYLAFSPKRETSQRYAKMWDVGIERLRKSGELDTIMKSYGLKDWIDPR
jgi:polar amino acid transport system substrate-binding protein